MYCEKKKKKKLTLFQQILNFLFCFVFWLGEPVFLVVLTNILTLQTSLQTTMVKGIFSTREQGYYGRTWDCCDWKKHCSSKYIQLHKGKH